MTEKRGNFGTAIQQSALQNLKFQLKWVKIDQNLLQKRNAQNTGPFFVHKNEKLAKKGQNGEFRSTFPSKNASKVEISTKMAKKVILAS